MVLVQGRSDVLDSDRDLKVLDGQEESHRPHLGAPVPRKFQQAYASPPALRLKPTAMLDNLAKLQHLMALQEQGRQFAALAGRAVH